MKTLTDIKTELKELNDKKISLEKEIKSLYTKELDVLLKKYKKDITSVDIYINNHEFNDGDPTYFSFNYDDLTIHYSDELGNEYEYDGYTEIKNDKIDKIRKEFVKFFSTFDIDKFYENIYSDEYESLVFETNN